MKGPSTRLLLTAILGSLAVTACAPAASSRNDGPAQGGVSAAEFETIFRARTDSARMRYTDADVQFMLGMIHHHAQALEMSRLAPTRGASPAVQTLAARIDNAQTDEIRLMQTWLRDRGQPVPELHVMGGRVMVHDAAGGHGAHHDHHAMPGMLAPEQLASLERARGAAFDRLFLTLMIEHHRGAVEMVRALFATDGAGQDEEAFRFASDVQVDQITEVRRMEQMLSSLPSGGQSP